MEVLWVGYAQVKTACQSLVLTKNNNLVRFPILLRDYLVIETASERSVNDLFTAVLLLISNALTLLHLMYRGARVMCCASLELDTPPAFNYASGADLLKDSYIVI